MRIDIEDIIPLLTQPREYEKYWTARCPFHEQEHQSHTPSLLVYKKDGFFVCKSCNAKGNLDKLHRALLGYRVSVSDDGNTQWVSPVLPPYSQLDIISDLVAEAHHVLLEHEHLAWYLERRGIADRIDACRLGWYDGWITIPILNAAGAVMGLVVRAGPHIEANTEARFSQPKGQPGMLYIPDHKLVTKSDTMFVTYGIFDTLSLSSIRLCSCSPTTGKGNMKAEFLDFWKGRVVMVPDQNEEETAFKFAASLPPARQAKVCLLEYSSGLKDPNDYLKQGLKTELEKQLERYK